MTSDKSNGWCAPAPIFTQLTDLQDEADRRAVRRLRRMMTEIQFTNSPLIMMAPRVLVTGSSGFIGKAVLKALQMDGYEVFKFDRSDGLDVTNADSVNSVFNVIRPNHVIHLAGILGTNELFDHVRKAVNVNIMGTINILEACTLHRTAYIGVTMLPVFPSIYTATKVSAQRFASAYHHNYDIPVCHVRAFNAYGPGQKHGEGHPRKIIPAFATEGWQGIPLKIWGDGTQTVDLIHTDDIAHIFVNSLGIRNDKIIEAGTGHSVTVNEVAEFVLDVTGSKAGVEHLPMRRGEIPSDQVVATGVGWELLEDEDVPKFSWDTLAKTVLSYK